MKITKDTYVEDRKGITKDGDKFYYRDRCFRQNAYGEIHELSKTDNAYYFYCAKNGRTTKQALADNFLYEIMSIDIE